MKENMNKFSSLAIVGLLMLSGCLGIGDDGVIGDNLNPQAVAVVSSGQKVVDLGEAIQFDASGSSDDDGSIVSYLWDFGDGTQSTNKLANHKYLNPGEYIISLSVTDDKGAVGNNDRKLSYVTVLHPEVSSSSNLPYALISVKSSVIRAGSEIEFNGNGSWAWLDGSPSTAEIQSCSWDFGDGNTATGSIVKHTFGSSGGFSSYSSVGSYPVKLTAYSSGGSFDVVYQTIRVLSEEF
ncbi:uncharacterized protein METZ01_LOCUS287796, partial [marine metagenome]